MEIFMLASLFLIGAISVPLLDYDITVCVVMWLFGIMILKEYIRAFGENEEDYDEQREA